MKKIKYLLLLSMFSLFLTGCVKYEAKMDIKSNKSMEYSIIYAFDSSYFGGQSIIDEDERQTLKEAGYTVEDYEEGSYEGVRISLNIKNIDSVSSESSVDYSVSNFGDYKKGDKIFQVEKGLFKNKYTAKFNFESSDSDLESNGIDSQDLDEEDDDWDFDYDYDEDDDWDFDYNEDDDDWDYDYDDDDSDMDYSSYMDLSFKVYLPKAAISSNATRTSNNGKELKWILGSDEAQSIEFQFELYNMGLIYGIIAGLVLIIGAVVVVIIMKNKKKNNSSNTPAPVQPINSNIPVSSVQPADTNSLVTPIQSVNPVVNNTVVSNVQEVNQPIQTQVTSNVQQPTMQYTPAPEQQSVNQIMPTMQANNEVPGNINNNQQ